MYSVLVNKWIIKRDKFGISHSNFITTPYLGRARHFAKKLPRKIRQIDVVIYGKKKYVLEGSWL
jgi:hypothetical protein